MRYDAVVIGAGPAGSTAALLLARAGWSIAIVEKSRFPRRKVCGEFISATSMPLLHELGVLDDFLHQAGPEVRQVGLFAKDATLSAPMPQPANAIASGAGRWGVNISTASFFRPRRTPGRTYGSRGRPVRCAASVATPFAPSKRQKNSISWWLPLSLRRTAHGRMARCRRKWRLRTGPPICWASRRTLRIAICRPI